MLDKFDKIIIESNRRLYRLHLDIQSLAIRLDVRARFWLDAMAELARARCEKADPETIVQLEKKVAKKKFFFDHPDVDILDYLDVDIP